MAEKKKEKGAAPKERAAKKKEPAAKAKAAAPKKEAAPKAKPARKAPAAPEAPAVEAPTAAAPVRQAPAPKPKQPAYDGRPTVKIRYVRSAIGSPYKHKLVVKSLGFKRLNQIVTRVDTPAVRGMVAEIPHLVAIV